MDFQGTQNSQKYAKKEESNKGFQNYYKVTIIKWCGNNVRINIYLSEIELKVKK